MRRRTLALILGLFLVGGLSLDGPLAGDWTWETLMEADFDVDRTDRLRVEIPDGDVQLKASDSNRVEITVYFAGTNQDRARGLVESMEFRAHQEGDTVHLEARKARRSWNPFRGFGVGIRVLIRLPQELEVDLSTGDGDVRIDKVSGELRVATGDGDVELREATGPETVITTGDGDLQLGGIVSEEIEIRTGDGDVVIGEIGANRIKVSTGDGDVVIESVSGSLSASTGDGDLTIGLARPTKVSLSTGDGDIDIEIDESLGLDIDLSGESVTLRHLGRLEGSLEDDSAVGKLNGGGPSLRARTGDGDISLSGR